MCCETYFRAGSGTDFWVSHEKFPTGLTLERDPWKSSEEAISFQHALACFLRQGSFSCLSSPSLRADFGQSLPASLHLAPEWPGFTNKSIFSWAHTVPWAEWQHCGWQGRRRAASSQGGAQVALRGWHLPGLWRATGGIAYHSLGKEEAEKLVFREVIHLPSGVPQVAFSMQDLESSKSGEPHGGSHAPSLKELLPQVSFSECYLILSVSWVQTQILLLAYWIEVRPPNNPASLPPSCLGTAHHLPLRAVLPFCTTSGSLIMHPPSRPCPHKCCFPCLANIPCSLCCTHSVTSSVISSVGFSHSLPWTGGKELPILVTSRIGNIYRSVLSKILRVTPGQEPQGRVSSVSTRSACLMLK